MQSAKYIYLVIMDAIDRLRKRLEYFLSTTDVSPEGYVVERRKLVAQVNNLKILIHPNEHPPPHFHVKADSLDASFEILTCRKLKGEISGQDLKRVIAFHRSSRDLLVETWNELRPTDCPVGPIQV
jgi:hypothetical protein